jgi:hypothetical protein
VKFNDFDMGSPGWLKHGAEMFQTQPKIFFSNGVSQASRQNLSRPIPSTGSLVGQSDSKSLIPFTLVHPYV